MSKPDRSANIQVDPRVTTAMNDLGFRLFAKLNTGNENVFISPASIELALAMTYNGAGGATKTAMAKALGIGELTEEELNNGNNGLLALMKNPDPKVELAIANSLWGRQGITFKPDFLQRVGKSYQAKLTTLDFLQPQAADTINDWVSDNTRGKIPTLVSPPMLRDAYLVLINAIYFKGAWTTPFDKEQTQDGPFTLPDGTKKTLPMMRQTGDFAYQENDAFQAVSLPYGSGDVVMDIFLPRPVVRSEDFRRSLTAAKEDFRKSLTAANWSAWQKAFRKREGTIVLPRFKAKYETALKNPLTALGMGHAFSDQADFSGMIEGERAQITDAIHKTVLEVNEEGTVAAGVTGVIVGVTAMPADPPFRMIVDRPFFLAIRHVPTGTVLFMGMINNPE
ncbi:MAG: serpin family protein [Armatimonadota bacterium]